MTACVNSVGTGDVYLSDSGDELRLCLNRIVCQLQVWLSVHTTHRRE